ncbi:uncharacterized protein K452DRAFT_300389 [Aplosporella prunicola CBS 121167]|uniref:DUF7918 domain-containing protein n=1 Tax=Aplosporella prunicola CBS 121167 TaxID=1176127 RepID=A0A6A6B5A7_9PEZI|nr:uncharacterized protein K452DRAFT_300389 [Aplosporella prunicola CBS 121167]KAF2139329.1 hypothetical protein K452DRAFT_300389 [Aplosporella prunicola CBS 121167]
MPCFQGLAVSIHTPDGPLPEYSIQKQSRSHRITSYIPVPPAKVPVNSTSNKPEQSTFAISITLLTPGLNVPYSTPKPTPEDPYPRPRIVGGLPNNGIERGKYGPVIGPYIPLTSSANETIAAYIYFDGRAKEEVATLLRRGEETWVNSRWVSVPESEGGGLAEREFLFREVGLERWLNGLDLEGKEKDVAARIERRKKRLEKKRRKKEEAHRSDDSDEEMAKPLDKNGVLRYGDDRNDPVEALSGDEGLFTSDSDSDDEPPMPEAAGQIKVALFRVLASGEIKRGEYSPQFDAHDDDDAANGGDPSNADADVDHTTSFAKPKSLDPKSISTQTVTGIDPPDRPYAVFTFFYRGEKQLRKMGILPTLNAPAKAPVAAKRKSGLDFGSLKPLTTTGTKGFAGYRDPSAPSPPFKKGGKKRDDDAMDSDADDEEDARIGGADDDDDTEIKKELGSENPEDLARQGELAEGVRKIKLKRAHSAEPVNESSPPKSSTSPTGTGTGTPASTIGSGNPVTSAPSLSAALAGSESGPEVVGSPFKKQRASLPGFDDAARAASAQARSLSDAGTSSSLAASAMAAAAAQVPLPEVKQEAMEEDEEL